MKLLSSNKYVLNTVVFLLVSSTTIFSHLIFLDFHPTAAFWPAAGFTIGLLVIYDKKAIIGILTGLFVGYMITGVFFYIDDIWISLSDSFVSFLADIAFLSLFAYIVKGTGINEAFTKDTLIKFLIAILIGSFAYAAITSSFYFIFNGEQNFIDILLYNLFGHIIGALVYSLIIIFSWHYDEQEMENQVPLFYSILYVIFFSVFTFFIFYATTDYINYEVSKYIYLGLFFFTVFVFSYRMILITSMIFLTFAHAYYIPMFPETDISIVTTDVHLFLIIVLITSTLSRMILLETRRKNLLLKVSNEQLEDMIDSTFTLLRLGEKQQFQEEFNSEDYIRELFLVAIKIFKNFDKAACYLRGDEFVNFIEGYEYDIEFLNNFQFRIEGFDWERQTPMHVIESNKMVKQSLEDRYSKFKERVPELKETIKFCIFLKEDKVGGMSFDIIKGSSKKFTKLDYENIKSFQRIMNSFYQTRYLIARNNSLRDEIVLSLIRTLELYDQYTGGHSEEVANLSLLIAKRMKLNETDQYNVFWAGIVHDIGKVGIPSEILNKPDRLSLEEYDFIKKHPTFGYDILKRSEDLSEIADLVKHHHEWWNGSGYPDGLKEKQIPLGSRIIGVADAVSSMATKRPYTQIKTSHEILKELKLYKGIQFSPPETDEMIMFIEEGLLDKFYLEKNS